jgi:putative tryptophan/tyrosine transport system substrate-binding protein
MHFDRVRRRAFITLAARGQQSTKLRTIGVLGSDAAAWRPWTAALVERLHELGWIEGRTIAIEYRWSQARPERAAEIAAEFVHQQIDLVVTAGPHVAAVKQVTAVIPIVFALANDPVGGGMVASLARPGGNVTGLSTQGTDLAGEVLPRLRRLAVIANAGYPDGVLEMREVQSAAHTLGLEVAPLEVRRAETSLPPSRRSRPTPTHFTSWAMLSLTPIVPTSIYACARRSVGDDLR